MKNFWPLLQREFKFFWGNKVLRLLFIGAPIFYGILLGYVYGKGKVTDLPIVVVDEDRSEMSSKVLQMFYENEVINIITILNDQQNLSQIATEKEATCVVIIPNGFEKMVLTKKYPEITTMINTSNVLTANYASSAIQLSLGTFKAGVQMETLRKQGVPESLLQTQFEPFKTTYIKKNNRSTNYMYFLWPGVLAAVLQQVLMLGLALSFAAEFENNTFNELVLKCSSIWKMMSVKITPYLIMSFGLWISFYLFTIWFRIPLFTNLLPITFIAGIFVISVSFIGILVSILIPNQLKATEVLMVVATPSFILSGFTWPLNQMPGWVQGLANIIPLTHFLKAFRILIIENGLFSQTYIIMLQMATIGAISAVIAFGALFYKKKLYLKEVE
jgi:ABC-2 type transport system permease protein